jgi:hypothetical protein
MAGEIGEKGDFSIPISSAAGAGQTALSPPDEPLPGTGQILPSGACGRGPIAYNSPSVARGALLRDRVRSIGRLAGGVENRWEES